MNATPLPVRGVWMWTWALLLTWLVPCPGIADDAEATKDSAPPAAPKQVVPMKPDELVAWLRDGAGARWELNRKRELVLVYCGFLGRWRPITPEIFSGLAALPSLERLHLNSAEFKDVDFPHVKGFAELRHLDLSHTNTRDDDLAAFAQATKLQVLVLDSTQLDGTGLRHLPTGALRYLIIVGPSVSDKAIEQVIRFPRLRRLSIGGPSITEKGLAELAKLGGLQHLTLSNCRRVDGEAIDRLSAVIKGEISTSNTTPPPW